MIKKFKQWLNESHINEDKGEHSYGCAMVFFDFPQINDIHSQIDEEDVYKGDEEDEDDNRSYGLEKDSHATLLYGLHDDEVDPSEVLEICTDVEYPVLKLEKVSTFENEKYDVLKFDVDCDVLHQINKKLKSLPHTNKFPDYHPHSTIAYLKPGTGKKYVEKFNELEEEVEPSKIVYSRSNGDKEEKRVKLAPKKEDSND